MQSAARIPDTRCGELHERLSSRVPGAGSFSRLQICCNRRCGSLAHQCLAEGPRQEDVHILQAEHSSIGPHGSAVETLVKFIGYGDGLLMALHVGQLRLVDRNPFHLAHLDASGASRPGMAVPDEFHEACRGANTPHALAILQTRLQKSEMAAYTGYVPVLADSFAERTELTPSRLFSSARRNCSRDGSCRQLPASG